MYCFRLTPVVAITLFFLEMLKGLPNFFRVVHSNDIVIRLAPCCSALFLNCKVKDHCPLHGGEELWYDNDMETDDTYVVCDKDGDTSCKNMFASSLLDHLTYFGVRLGSYCVKKSDVEDWSASSVAKIS